MARVQRITAAALAAVVLVAPATAALGAGPAGAQAAPSAADAGAGGGDELATARSELGRASRELSELEALLQRTADEVAALDERLAAAGADLVVVTAELEQAQGALEVALAAERDAALALAAADRELDTLLSTWEGHRQRLAERAVQAFKHGTATPQDVLVRGVATASDWHEVAVTLETVARLTGQDRTLLDGSAELTRATADARAAVTTARTRALDTAREAAREARRVAALQEAQTAVVEEIADKLARREAALTQLEEDVAARALLVRRLEERVRSLELAARMVLVPVDLERAFDGPPPPWTAGLPPRGQPWATAIDATAARHGIDGRLLAALVWTESGFHPGAVSRAGALGLAQLMPGTARGLGVDPADPLQNLDGGARYLRTQLDRFGRVDLALAAYNAGPGRVERAGRVPDIVETQLYVVRVLERYERLPG